MKKLKIAIRPAFDRAIVDIVLRRHLRDATGEEYEVEYEVTSDRGGFALIECPDSDWDAVNTVVKDLAPAMEFLNKSDPHGALRRLSTELKKDRAETEAEIERLMAESPCEAGSCGDSIGPSRLTKFIEDGME